MCKCSLRCGTCSCSVIIHNLLFYLAEAIVCFVVLGISHQLGSPLYSWTCSFVLSAIAAKGATDVVSFFLASCSRGNLIVALVGHLLNIIACIFPFIGLRTITLGKEYNTSICTQQDEYNLVWGTIIALCVLTLYPLAMFSVVVKKLRYGEDPGNLA